MSYLTLRNFLSIMAGSQLTIRRRSHHLVLLPHADTAVVFIEGYCRRLVEYTLIPNQGNLTSVPDKVYAVYRSKAKEYRIHFNLYQDFINFVGNKITYEIIDDVPTQGEIISLPIFDKWVLRENQVPFFEYSKHTPKLWEQPNRILTCQPGAGKSFILMKTMSDYKRRAIIVMRPTYMFNFESEMWDTYDISAERVLTVAGSHELVSFLNSIKDNTFDKDIVMISNRTLYRYFKSFISLSKEEFYSKYPLDIDELFKYGRFGLRAIDEVHQDFHLNFTLDLFTNVTKSLSLSATLVPGKNRFLSYIQNVAYPDTDRFVQENINVYVDAYAMIYNLESPTKANYTNGAFYSHNTYEKYLLSRKKLLSNYVDYIKMSIDFLYMNKRVPGKKFLVFVSSGNMGKFLQIKLQSIYPDLIVGRYIRKYKDPKHVLLDSDIIVSTLQSCGTAVTVPNLSGVFLSVAIDSESSNKQAFGRIRELADSDKHVFGYAVCNDIRSHRSYHSSKKEYLTSRVNQIQEIQTRIYV